MRVLLSTYGSRGDVEPMGGLAVQSRALGAEIWVCAPPDDEFAELLAGVRPAPARGRVAAAQFATVAGAAEECDARSRPA